MYGTCEDKGKRISRRFRYSWSRARFTPPSRSRGATPWGWVTYGPREGFPRVAYSRELKRAVPKGSWSIVCFYIPTQWWGKGIANQLLDAAIGYCRAHGAVEIEAFPIEILDSPLRKRATDIYTGVASQFVKAGFISLPRVEKQRVIYVKRP